MIEKLYSGLSIFAIATLVSVLGFTGSLFASGKLNKERLGQIGDVLRGVTPHLAPASQPTSKPSTAHEEESPAESTSPGTPRDIEARHTQEHLQTAALDRAKRDVLAQRELLDQSMLKLVSDSEKFELQRKAWLEQQKRLREANADEGFNRELEIFRKLPSSQAKEHLLKVWAKEKTDAVRLMANLKASETKRIFEQMKTPEESSIMTELLEQLRKQDVDQLVPESRKTPDDAPQ